MDRWWERIGDSKVVYTSSSRRILVMRRTGLGEQLVVDYPIAFPHLTVFRHLHSAM